MRVALLLFLLLGTTVLSAQSIRDRMRERRQDRGGNETVNAVIPAAPDYANLYYWAAHPSVHDYSDSVPVFLQKEPVDTSVDVFFLHPTTYVKEVQNRPMNADVNDTVINHLTDTRTILFQASVFNGSARVFAPRYRQASIKAFVRLNSDESKRAFDLAYEDLADAFQYYLDHWNKGRPVIIAAHSQGAMHAIRLLQDFFDGKPLQQQLICAYVVGWPVKKNDLKHIPLGDSPLQTGCVLAWQTFRKEKTGRIAASFSKDALCVNPISWTSGNDWSAPEQYKGCISKKDFNQLSLLPVTAAVNAPYHVLWVSGLQATGGDNEYTGTVMAENGNLHNLDITLFYINIRENVKQRVQAYWQKQ